MFVIILSALEGIPQATVGVYNIEVPPVPIPNTVVKLNRAENTWRAAAREDRSSPAQKNSSQYCELFFCTSYFFTIHYSLFGGAYMKLTEQLNKFVPCCEQEKADKKAFIDFIKNNSDCLSRENLSGHITVSAWIVNKEKTKVLFCYHNIYNSWSWVGGHADGETNLLSVALREAKEETGVTAKPVCDEIFSLEILPVSGHIKKGKYVPSHIHYNVTYLLEADENEKLSVCEDENSAVAWIDINDIPQKSTEKWMIENIYNKITKKQCSDF